MPGSGDNSNEKSLRSSMKELAQPLIPTSSQDTALSCDIMIRVTRFISSASHVGHLQLVFSLG